MLKGVCWFSPNVSVAALALAQAKLQGEVIRGKKLEQVSSHDQVLLCLHSQLLQPLLSVVMSSVDCRPESKIRV